MCRTRAPTPSLRRAWAETAPSPFSRSLGFRWPGRCDGLDESAAGRGSVPGGLHNHKSAPISSRPPLSASVKSPVSARNRCFTITTLDQNGNQRSVQKRSDGTSSSSSSCSGSTTPAFVASPRFNLPSASTSPVPAISYLTPTSQVPYTPSSRAPSPILKPLVRTRTPFARQLHFNMDRVHWSPELTKFFLDACVDQCRAGNRPTTTLNTIGKDNVVRRLEDHTGRHWTWDPCKHKWDDLRKKWACWKRLIKLSGVTFHPKTKLINMPQEWWDQQILANPIAKVFMHTQLEYEEQLDIMFVNLDPINIGPDESGGHEGGRAGAPTHYLDSDTSNDSDDDTQKQLPSPPPPHSLCAHLP
ncbi:hypothetical protein BS78_01G298900 [Paspalum vaginatum]|nr:hypothetical protein BS78_01G298900 [Paspalum vaginatum]